MSLYAIVNNRGAEISVAPRTSSISVRVAIDNPEEGGSQSIYLNKAELKTLMALLEEVL